MERIIIIGGNGCGKTTVAKKLSQMLNLPLVHLDTLYWRDNWQNVSAEEFDELLLEELHKPQWILDGNILRTLPLRLKYCDTVIYMDFPRLSCVWGVMKRTVTHYGKSRPDMGGYCPEGFDREEFAFLKTVWNFNRKNRKRIYTLLECEKGIEKIILRNRRQVKKFLLHHNRNQRDAISDKPIL